MNAGVPGEQQGSLSLVGNHKITGCRSCGQSRLKKLFSLGSTPLANALLTGSDLDKPEITYPLDLVLCSACFLAQITFTVSPKLLFSHYLYFSSYSDSTLSHARHLSKRIIGDQKLTSDSLVIEIASNDGYLLKQYVAAGIPVLGIDPAENIARIAENNGVRTLCRFFDESLARKLVFEEGIKADVVHAHNVLGHVADLNSFLSGIKLMLKADGIAVIEVPYVKDMVDGLEFDTIYHEHLCYFSVASLQNALELNGMYLLDIEPIPIHGGSIRAIAGKSDRVSAAVAAAVRLESEQKVNTPDYYSSFRDRAWKLRVDLLSLLRELKASGKTIAAYGASAKGSVLLNFMGIGADLLSYVVDRNPHKQGKFTPGKQLPIYPAEKLLGDSPDYVLVLSWNFTDEILMQQTDFRNKGGKFILPIPNLAVV